MLPAAERELLAKAKAQAAQGLQRLGETVEAIEEFTRVSENLSSRLHHEVLTSRMRPLADGVRGFPRLVRDLARELGKQARFEVVGETTGVDRDILDRLEAPLNHLIRNAMDHGLEMPEDRRAAGKPPTGTIRLEARHRAGMLQIILSDDGRGIDLERLRAKVVERGLTTAAMAARLSETELLDFLFLPGFSTKEQVTEVSGRGVGLDVVQSMVHAVRGSVRVASRPGKGTRFVLQLPITVSVIRALLVEIAGEPYAFPLEPDRPDLRCSTARTCASLRASPTRCSTISRWAWSRRPGARSARRTRPASRRAIAGCGRQRPQPSLRRGRRPVPGRARPTRLAAGRSAGKGAQYQQLLGAREWLAGLDRRRRGLDPLDRQPALRTPARQARHRAQSSTRPARRKRVLVVDDSITVRELERQYEFYGGASHHSDISRSWNCFRYCRQGSCRSIEYE